MIGNTELFVYIAYIDLAFKLKYWACGSYDNWQHGQNVKTIFWFSELMLFESTLHFPVFTITCVLG